jgi:hypothetical protein
MTDDEILKAATAIQQKRLKLKKLESFEKATYVEIRWVSLKDKYSDYRGASFEVSKDDVRHLVQNLRQE